MNQSLLSIVFLSLLSCSGYSQDTDRGVVATDYLLPVPSDRPNAAQQAQIDRKYGMFMHFGINTFVDQEWTDGSIPPSAYAPSEIDAEQWIRGAKEAGMKYVILITKHHDGFCLWDSKYTDYDVASSPNKTNVVEAVAKACRKYKIGLGMYYSLWDRHQNAEVKDCKQDAAYAEYMLGQITELLDIALPYGPVVEFWFDGSWVKPNYRWPLMDIYRTIKTREPYCQVGVNWSIGKPDAIDYHAVYPEDQQEDYPIRYFPSDFRLGDPMYPKDDDPKLFMHNGREYYMPWESTVTLTEKWFYNTTDTVYKSLDDLEKIYRQCTKNDNILIINCPPDRKGKLREKDIEVLKQLRKRLGL